MFRWLRMKLKSKKLSLCSLIRGMLHARVSDSTRPIELQFLQLNRFSRRREFLGTEVEDTRQLKSSRNVLYNWGNTAP
jgi:hypothetical protein